MKFTAKNKSDFEAWLALDINAVTNEGRQQQAFEQVWEKIFYSDQEFSEIFHKLHQLASAIESGPLLSWLDWLKKKFIIFIFYQSNLNLGEFSETYHLEESELIFIVRDHLYQLKPQDEDTINQLLCVGNIISDKRDITFKQILDQLNLSSLGSSHHDDEIMTSLEVVLFPAWSQLQKTLSQENLIPEIDLRKMKGIFHWRTILGFSREIVVILLIAGAIIWTTKEANQWYEGFIANKIQIFEPSFLGIDKTLTYRPDDKEQRVIELSNKEIELLEKIESAKSIEDIPETRFDPESDEVILTSVEEIMKDLNEADQKPSEFEENNKGGFRDMTTHRGGRKAYRVLMTSVFPKEVKDKIMPLLEEYKISQKDNVKPGTEIPGGIYFNLLVPSENLKEFLGRINSIQETTLFESNPREGTPIGKNKVFIWIKSI